MADKKSYNILALRGQDMDDMEYVNEFGLDPSVAYTPKINDAMLTKVEQDNIKFYTERQGMSEVEAAKKARANRMTAERSISKLMRRK